MYKFNLNRQSVVQSSCYISNEHKKSIAEAKEANLPPKSFSLSSTKIEEKVSQILDRPPRKKPPKRRNKLNFSQATISKIGKSLDAIYLFKKAINEQNLTPKKAITYGYFYEFYLPKDCQHSCYSINKDIFSPFIENLCKNHSLKLYCWTIKHDKTGSPYYLLYTPDQINSSNPKKQWLERIQKYFFYDDNLKINPFQTNHYAKLTVVTSKNSYYKKVKYSFLKRNDMPFSACKKFINRECKIYRSFGRTQKLADILPLNVTLEEKEGKKFIKQLEKHSGAVFNESYYIIYYLSTETYWYQKIYTRKLQEMLLQKLNPLYQLELTG